MGPFGEFSGMLASLDLEASLQVVVVYRVSDAEGLQPGKIYRKLQRTSRPGL